MKTVTFFTYFIYLFGFYKNLLCCFHSVDGWQNARKPTGGQFDPDKNG